jgi:hypothetical protein
METFLPPEPDWCMFLLGAMMSTATGQKIDPFEVPEVKEVMRGMNQSIKDLNVPKVQTAIRRLISHIDDRCGAGFTEENTLKRFREKYFGTKQADGGMA